MTELTSLSHPDALIVYGIDACEDTTRALRHLEAAGLPHRYVKLDVDADAKARVTGAGYHATPVVVTPTGQAVVEPSDAELVAIVESITASTAAADAR
jgi:uncharacterized SAM-dependent methyltransferase